ncbi:MAG TPA: helix-turn-helix domain-containing protein [Woeseiaceae bacterium]|nr:helix-turn-helix domain-containing protein [Woeseiaceae bacterium]
MADKEYRVGQLAQASQTKTVTIRYYEREGLMRNPPRNCSGYRIYNDADLDRLLFIRRSRHLGFSVDTVRELLDLADTKDAPCADVDARVSQHLGKVHERLSQLRTLKAELVRLSDCCKGGGAIRDCRIIESLSGNRGGTDELRPSQKPMPPQPAGRKKGP